VRVAYGARISLLVGILSTLLATIGGTALGLVSGYYGGWIDALLARLMDAVLSFPYVLAAIVLAAVFGGSLPLTIGVIAFFSWAAIGRIVRGQTLSQKEKEYVEAARSIGAGSFRIMFVDILPNLIAPVIVLGTLLVRWPSSSRPPSTIWASGGAADPDLGQHARRRPGVGGIRAWWFWVFPSIALLITTLGFNLLGDSVRDALDPRTERLFAMRRKKVAAAGPDASAGAGTEPLSDGTEA